MRQAVHRTMRLRSCTLVLGTAGVVLCAGVFLGSAFTVQPDRGNKPDLTRAKFYGVAECKDCHVPEFTSDHDQVLLNEYPTWKTRDKHALAYTVLEGPRGKQMANVLGVDVIAAPMCLSCHSTAFLPSQGSKSFSPREGVGCDGCHGPAEHWIIDHGLGEKKYNWRNLPLEEKEHLGMFNVRDPFRRGELCVSCHVGSAAEGKVMTHSMYAAGHPPLPGFELATFSRNMPQHWLDMKDVPFLKKASAEIQKQYHYETKDFQQTGLVLAGATVAMRQTMELLAVRADTELKLTGKPDPQQPWPPPWLLPHLRHDAPTRWPELTIDQKFGLSLPAQPDWPKVAGERWPEFMMAQADCYACHHELKTPSWRQRRGYAGRPGRPQGQLWPLVLARLTLTTAEAEELNQLLGSLHKAFDARPFGDAPAVSTAAQHLAGFFKTQGRRPLLLTRDAALGYLQKLTATGKDDFPDFDSARLIAGAFRAIFCDAWNEGHPKQAQVMKILSELDDKLGLSRDSMEWTKFGQERQALMTPFLKRSMADLLKSSTDSEKQARDQFLTRLQGINDAELKQGLRHISDYDPAFFKKRLAELSRLLADHR